MLSVLAVLVAMALMAPMEGRIHVKTLRGKDLHMMYRDHGSGAYEDLSVYCPHPPTGWSILGHYAEKGYMKSGSASVLVVKEVGNSTLLAHPVRYRQIWNTKFTGGRIEGAIWRPIPPAGYICMGDVVTLDISETPSTDTVACVHSSLVGSSKAKRVWWNKLGPFCSSRYPQKDVALWQPASKSNCHSANTFRAKKGFSIPPAELDLFHCLRDVDGTDVFFEVEEEEQGEGQEEVQEEGQEEVQRRLDVFRIG